jgi:sporulation protein YlmC with PRC-barrel domain
MENKDLEKDYSKKDSPGGPRAHLYRLNDLDDYEISQSDPDVRGWKVLGSDSERLGEVVDLVVDLNKMKVRYLDIDINEQYKKESGEHHMLVPIGLARINDKDDTVVITTLGKDNIHNYPVFKGDPISREYENSVHETIGFAVLDTPMNADEFYEHEYYDEQMFYGPRRTKSGMGNDPNLPVTAFKRRE